MTKYLITGIPGTGKTTIGNYLQVHKDFKHIDLEDQIQSSEFYTNPINFINNLLQFDKLVVTWGFIPNSSAYQIIGHFINNRFKFIWFDGNRKSARREFIKRNTVSVELLDIQMKRIEDSYSDIMLLKPIIINTFNKNGLFKSPSEIIKEFGIV